MSTIVVYITLGGEILVWKTIILFGLLGPVIGSFVFVGTNALQFAEFQNLSISEICSKLGFGIWASMLAGILGIPIAMVFGIVPAGISGLVYWVISRDLKLKNPRAAKRFLVGSTTSLSTSTILFVAFYLYNYFHYGSDESFSYGWWFFAWPSCISGGICGVFIKDDSSA